jgi:hypothetical protein
MKKLLLITLATFAFAACGEDTDEGARPDCNKACRQANDVYIKPDGYTQYFVNDSDGGKDLVFYVVRDVPFLATTDDKDGIPCDVIKSFDAEGVGLAVVCPDGANVTNGSGGQSNNDEEESE